MLLTVSPVSALKGTLQLPASKSYSIRAFIIAACGGKSIIHHPSDCDDAKVAIHVAKALGAKVIQEKTGKWSVNTQLCSTVILPQKINVKESGTVLRFLLPLLSLHGKKVSVCGEGTLSGRPNKFLTHALRGMGVEIRGKGGNESIPIEIQGGQFRSGNITIDGTLSSQFISALLITCPQLVNDSCLLLKGKQLVSTDYITMTIQILQKSGIKIVKKDARKYFIRGGQKFKGLKSFHVPSDYGLAAFMLGAAALIKSELTFKGALRDDLIQADGHIFPLLKKMGVQFKKTSQSIKIKGPFLLKGGDFSLKDCPDLVPIMAILALFARGKTRLCNIKHARVKESDRISDLRKELLKIGAKVRETADELIIDPQLEYKKGCLLDPHNDHRLAMSFCVLGLKIGTRVKNITCTHKSYPEFIKDFKTMGAKTRRGHQ